jgi:SAM-dependent methyltransferase
MTGRPPATLKRAIGPLVARVPYARRAMRRTVDAVFRTALRQFDRGRRPGIAQESSHLVSRTESLNQAAEQYFARFEDRDYLLGKPFTDEAEFPRYLFSLGVLLQGLRLRRSDVVVEFGAGSCWVSHFLNRFGCKTISIDVSRTALDLGREAFRRDSSTNWAVDPEFVAYDGHRIPLPDASCDKVIVFDAFHHVPNQREILTELCRILRPDGMVAMCEPGTGHADTEASRREVERYGVLENELVAEDVGALAVDCGFAAAHLIVASPRALCEIPCEDLGPFIRGKGFAHFWAVQSNALIDGHYFVLYKGDPRPNTTRPKTLGARIALVRTPSEIRIARGERATVPLEIANVAETTWLSAPPDGRGWTRVGVHLLRAGEPPVVVDFDWLRVELPHDVRSGTAITLTLQLPAVQELGLYHVVFDLVIEGTAWFAERGSKTAVAHLRVGTYGASTAVAQT